MKRVDGKIAYITGGAGSIGCNLIRLLLEEGAEKIHIVDNLSSGRHEFIPDDPRISFEELDIADTLGVDKSLTSCQPDYIFHLAANFANQNSVDHPYLDIQSNIIGTLNILEAAKKLPNLKKIVYTSSSCVYGSQEVMAETNLVYPHETPYAINKLAAEMYVMHYATLYGLPGLSVRLFNSYGPYEAAGEYRNVIPNFIHKALHGEELVITGTGEETRDFVFVMDSAELMCKMALSDIGDGSYYNSGGGRETTIGELATTILRLTGSKSVLRYTKPRVWDGIKRRVSDTSKTRNTFDFVPRFSLEEGMKITVDWHQRCLDEN
ncbi:MAG: NAD-dependent epimerase/dehydratase family protein [Pseudodesulfovibrio sp.]|nr:NAD-dependent epimerase/dehydratase family protein [Pseudodesulfovibrio sp.]